MTVTITATFANATKETGFETQVEIINVEGIPLDVLTFNTEDGSFSHVASVFDMETYPASREASQALNLKFFRARTVTRLDSSLVLATEFATVTRARLQFLSVTWQAAKADFQGEETVTFTSDTN